MNRLGVYEYDPVIYPRKLWVHIGKDLEKLIDAEFYGCIPPEKEYGGVTYKEVVRKTDKKWGVLISFPASKGMTMGVCAHEASHACDDIEEALGIHHGGETSAYLLDWIASCINKARLGIGNFIEIKQPNKGRKEND